MCGASRRARTSIPSTRGAMNYSIRNLVIAGGLAIVSDCLGAHLHEQRAERRQGGAGARQGVRRSAWTCRRARRRRTSLHGATSIPEGSHPGRSAPRRPHLHGRHRQHGAEAGSLHRPAGLRAPIFVTDQRSRLDRGDPRYHARLSINVKAANGLVGTRGGGDHVDIYGRIGSQLPIMRKVLSNVLVLQGADRPEGHDGRRQMRTCSSR